MRYPCEYWIKALLSIEPSFSTQQVEDALVLRGFPKPTSKYLSGLQSAIEATKPPLYDIESDKTKNWLRSCRVLDLVQGRPEVGEAYRILNSPQIREVVEVLLTGDVSFKDISNIVYKRYNKIVSELAVEYYRHYYWNTSIMSPSDWKEFLAEYRNGDVLYTVVNSRDKYIALINVGEELNISPEDMVKTMTDHAFAKFYALSRRGADDLPSVEAAKSWAGIALKGIELQEKNRSSVDALREVLDTIKVRYADNKPLSIEDIKAKGGLLLQPSTSGKEKE